MWVATDGTRFEAVQYPRTKWRDAFKWLELTYPDIAQEFWNRVTYEDATSIRVQENNDATEESDTSQG